MPSSRKILISGCARSGTKYMSNVLNRCGIKAGHEWTDEHGSVTHFFPINSERYPYFSWEKPPKAHVGERYEDFEFENFWHQVRDPLLVVGSCRVVVSISEWKWLGRHFPVMAKYNGKDRTLTSLAYWYHFNMMCEGRASWTYRIEDLKKHWVRFQTTLGISGPLPDTDTTVNRNKRFNQPWTSDEKKARNAENPTWSELYDLDPILTGRAQRLAVKYGYEV